MPNEVSRVLTLYSFHLKPVLIKTFDAGWGVVTWEVVIVCSILCYKGNIVQ